MALSVSFTAGQTPSSPNLVGLVDTTTGTDAAVVSRRIYITDAGGNAVVPSGTTTAYIEWGNFPATTTISLNILTEDMALNIRVDWINISNAVLYSDENTFCFDEYLKQFAYELVQGLVPPVTLDTNYAENLAKLWVAIKGAENSVTFANDIQASQNCLNQGTYLKTYQQLFF